MRSPARRPSRRPRRKAPETLEFAGCESASATEEDLRGPVWAERRYEYWHKASETAWFVREETFTHAASPLRLARFLQRVEQVRGSRIVSFGPGGLRILGPDGKPGDIMQPDLSVFVHPAHTRMPGPHVLTQGVHDWPDVVLEVDNTTDVRRGKLRRYQEWGLPEIWVEVPERGTRGRPRSLRPGCVIHRREAPGRYRRAEESGALPGLAADEIHAVMDEWDVDAMAHVARRVGKAMGVAGGTTVDDDPLVGQMLAEGRREGLAQGRAEMIGMMLRSRGIAVSPNFPARLPGVSRALATADESRLFEAVSRAADEADFVDRLLGCDTN